MKVRLRESTRDERRACRDTHTPMLVANVPGKPIAESPHQTYMVLEQWDEYRGGWFAVPVEWEQ